MKNSLSFWSDDLVWMSYEYSIWYWTYLKITFWWKLHGKAILLGSNCRIAKKMIKNQEKFGWKNNFTEWKNVCFQILCKLQNCIIYEFRFQSGQGHYVWLIQIIQNICWFNLSNLQNKLIAKHWNVKGRVWVRFCFHLFDFITMLQWLSLNSITLGQHYQRMITLTRNVCVLSSNRIIGNI